MQEKAVENCQVAVQKATAKEPSMRCRNRIDGAKTWYSSLPGTSLMDTCLLIRRHPAHRWRDLHGGI